LDELPVTAADPAVVAMVHLGRTGSMGGVVRTAGLVDIFEQAGARIVDVPLLVDHRARPADILHSGISQIVAGGAVPESLAWSHRSVLRRLQEIQPTIVLCSTARSYHPALRQGPWTVVLDYVDRLSESYRDRALIRGPSARSLAFRALSQLAARFEGRPVPEGMIGVAAGWADARSLGLEWVPITRRLPAVRPDGSPTHDLLFVGKLSYEPNVEAIEQLARMWPAITAGRPGTSLLLAGASPEPRVLELAAGLGWTVEVDFADLGEVMGRARLAVVPLAHASGIQTKVLDAAMYGVPQVLSSVATRGLAPGFPAVVADDDTFAAEVIALLDDPSRMADLGEQGRAHFADTYTPECWVGWAGQTLRTARSRRDV
jgi:glycosyltransferase involved in cell wall biosynthesis